ncbi:PLDc N-terminal domain-containing protein [Pacificimonas flava]|uniref:PLDc N-terminal domain-containing protein n=1 Tax=Pacificimonas flava TaxID=1234595 RepID=UPI00098FAE2D|nr:PLDc N-terminal domain-containing protein [Pacificimonas flava]
MLLVVPLHHAPAAATRWLLLIFFLPLPGLVLYLAIGRPRFPRWRTRRFQDLRPSFLTSRGGSKRRRTPASRAPALAPTGGEQYPDRQPHANWELKRAASQHLRNGWAISR